MDQSRNCPICDMNPNKNDILHHIEFSDESIQEISCCLECGMVFASLTPPIEYSKESIYASSDATGSGNTPLDIERFRNTVEILEPNFPDKEITILDIGCAQGGLLAELERHGYENDMGMDPSQACVDTCHMKNLLAFRGSLEDPPTRAYDLIILSHVLEHVWDVSSALTWIRKSLKANGKVYIEVPNASEYKNYLVCPFLDFNREHINHFSPLCLNMTLDKNGFQCENWNTREISLPNGLYPAVWGIYSLNDQSIGLLPDTFLKGEISQYIMKSKEFIHNINLKLRPKIENCEIVIWGYGEFLQQLFSIGAIQSAKIIQVIDKDPCKQGKLFHGISVESPDKLRKDIPVLVASMVNSSSIQANITKLSRGNSIILVEK